MAAIIHPSGPKVRILLGKGGVGKTVVASAVARTLADQGARTLLVELDGRPEITRHFGLEGCLPQEDMLLYRSPGDGCVIGRHVAADDALVGYLNDHGMKAVSRRLHKSGLIDVIAGSIPGLRDVLVLGKIKQFANRDDLDAIVVDGPATGHALTMLTSPAGLARVARTGPVKEQAEQVASLLADEQRCGVILVTTPEELPITETIEAAYRIEDEADITLSLIVANRVHRVFSPSVLEHLAHAGLDDSLAMQLREAYAFSQARSATEQPELQRLARDLAIDLIELPAFDGLRAESAMVADLAASLGAPTSSGRGS